MLRRVSPSGLLPNIETSSDRSREFPDTSCSSVADESCLIGGPFLLRTCVGTLRPAGDSCISPTDSFELMEAAPEVYHLRLQNRHCGLNEEEVDHLHLRPVLVCELDMLLFALTGQKLNVSSSEQIADNFGWYARLVKPNTFCPIVEYSTGEEYKPKAGHVIVSPFGSTSMVIPKFFICGRVNRISTLVEH